MTGLHTLLEGAVDTPDAVDVTADVRRGHVALRRRRRLFGAGVAVGALALGGGTGVIVRSHSSASEVVAGDPTNPPATVRAGSFVIPSPPDGWAVQAAGKSLVVIAPADLPKVDLTDPNLVLRVTGKLAIEYQHGSLREGRPIRYDGRSFYWLRSAGVPRGISVETPSGGWLRLQEAPKLHWTLHQMIEYLDGVQRLDGAPSR
jgi:hypothetical protein